MNSNDHRCVICGQPIDTDNDAFSAYSSERDDMQSILAHNSCIQAFNDLDSEAGQKVAKAAKREARRIAIETRMSEEEEREEAYAHTLAQFGRLTEKEQQEVFASFISKQKKHE